MLDSLKKGLICIFRNKLRAVLTITGIAVGVMSVVIVSSIGELGKSAISTELSGMGLDSLVVSAQTGGTSILSESDLKMIREVKNVSNAMPLMSVISESTIKNERVQSMVWGINEDADKVIDLNVLHGRLINKGDIAEESLVCVVDEAIAENAYMRSNIIGKHIFITLNGQDLEFEIIGVVKNGVNTLQNMLGGFIPDFVYIPYSVMQSCYNVSRFDQITVRLEDSNKSDVVAASIKNILSVEKKDSAVSVENLLKQKDKMNNIMGIATIALSAVAGISLIVSGISIMTVMLVSVSERTREIGIKKSIGASTYSIMFEFMLESVLITVTGALIGFISGAGISSLICILIGYPIKINLALCGAVMLISIFIGVLFGVYPAYKASKLKPVEALRHD